MTENITKEKPVITILPESMRDFIHNCPKSMRKRLRKLYGGKFAFKKESKFSTNTSKQESE